MGPTADGLAPSAFLGNERASPRVPRGEVSVAKIWIGRVLSGLAALVFIASGAMKVARAAPVIENMVGKFGYPENTVLPIGLLELGCLLVYLIPRTSVLGAILLTGYMGGATATHVRAGESFIPPVLV